ncbi:hypothetical protein M404DRAFT_17895, partial [Pisolithus tinctorius Marx 270]
AAIVAFAAVAIARNCGTSRVLACNTRCVVNIAGLSAQVLTPSARVDSLDESSNKTFIADTVRPQNVSSARASILAVCFNISIRKISSGGFLRMTSLDGSSTRILLAITFDSM